MVKCILCDNKNLTPTHLRTCLPVGGGEGATFPKGFETFLFNIIKNDFLKGCSSKVLPFLFS
jgi:hypothetical protein